MLLDRTGAPLVTCKTDFNLASVVGEFGAEKERRKEKKRGEKN